MAKTTRVSDQLDKLRNQLETERDEVFRRTAPLVREREALVAKIQPLEAELRKVDDKIKELERPLYDIGNGLAQLARADGARVLSNGVSEEPAPETKSTIEVATPTVRRAEKP